MSNARNRAISVSLGLPSLPRPHVIRRAQSTVVGLTPRSVRVVVLGVGGVGKTAMTVRFVTKRFIGDYDPTLETISRHTTVIDDQLVNFEIMDTAGQEVNSLMLEDKCKWGESFIFVYDVTDKYSFDELTRLKFIASYTHSKLRVNFSPCWVLVGNKSDLADKERMVSTEEGMALARDLGCHIFREISVKESLSNASEVFEDLWREFSRLSPRSPSSSHRRKFSCKIQDKISILNSNACTCASEALKNMAHNHSHTTDDIVSTLTNSLKRQTSAPVIQITSPRTCKLYNDANNNEERFDLSRNISRIPENIKEEEEKEPPFVGLAPPKFTRNRRNALINPSLDIKRLSPLLSRRKALSSDNVFSPSVESDSPVESSTMMTSSSTSSSNTSINSSSGSFLTPTSGGLSLKLNDAGHRFRSSSDASSLNRKNSKNLNDPMSLYHDYCRRTRGRRCDFNSGFPSSGFNPPCEVKGF